MPRSEQIDRRARRQTEDENLAPHVEEAVNALTELHRKHYREASLLQRAIDRTVDVIGQPLSGATLVAFVVLWGGAVFVLRGPEGAHTAAFSWLELIAAVAGLVVAVLILVAQRRESVLAERRDQLTLELSLLAERKTAKVISLLEELRRDAPDIANRRDPEGEEMARPADPETVLSAIDARTQPAPDGAK